MKNFWKMYSRNLGFWMLVYSFATTVTIIIMAVVWSRHECPKPDHEIKHKLEVLQLKQKRYEELITNDSIIIWNSDRKYRDSIRAIRFDNYLQR